MTLPVSRGCCGSNRRLMGKILEIVPKTDYHDVIKEAADVLLHGGIAAIPTDTVYGFAASAFDEAAIARLYEIKERSHNKSIAVLLGDISQAHLIAEDFSEKARRLAEKYWPGALTIIIRKKKGLPADLTSNDLVGLRIPDLDLARDLIRITGPLAVTSANISGEPPAKCIGEFAHILGSKLDIIIDNGPSRGGVPSSVINCAEDPAVILREGAVPGKELLEC